MAQSKGEHAFSFRVAYILRDDLASADRSVDVRVMRLHIGPRHSAEQGAEGSQT